MKLWLNSLCVLGLLGPLGANGSSRPDSAPPDFDCAVRLLALDFGGRRLDEQSFAQADALDTLREALEIDVYGCEESYNSARDANSLANKLESDLKGTLNSDAASGEDSVIGGKDSHTFYVDAASGDDSAKGGKDDPFLTLEAAVTASREVEGDKTILLRGMLHLHQAISLSEKDSGLRISTDPDEDTMATLSGGTSLEGIVWEKTEEPNIFAADLSSFGFDDVPGLHFADLGERGMVARFPNTLDPFKMNEAFGGDQRIEQGLATWLPPKSYKEDDYSYVVVPGVRNDAPDAWFADYVHGVGGSCAVYDPPVSYWCSNATQGGGAFQFLIPSGVVLDESFLPNLPKYNEKSLEQAVVNAWRPARWENWMFEGDFDLEKKTIVFTKGGFQGARGEKEGGDWFIENVFEELDAANEFFYNRSSKVLYLYLNSTMASSPEDYGKLVVPQEESVFNVQGTSKNNPVVGLTIENMKITGTRHTYLTAPHTVPSGGDWALERRGAIFLENTEQTLVQNVKVNTVDGHALMISGYNRNTTVRGNEFAWVGGSAIASWGRTDGETDEGAFSGMGGTFPRFNLVENNIVREVGHFEKQNSFYVQAKTAQSTIRNNVFFNGPRAGVNYNDGFGGGDVLEGNLIFNTCRESGDHGPFNSWDRQPFLTPIVDPEGSTEMEWRIIKGNFMIGNYQSQETVDNDDGSGYYLTEENFLVYSSNGLKSDFGGHDNHHISNIYAYVGSGTWGSGTCFGDITAQLEGHEDLYQDNLCVLSEGGDYGIFDDSGAIPKMGGNDVYVLSSDSVKTTGVNGVPLAEFQEKNPGVDDGSEVSVLEDWQMIIDKAKALLEI